MANGISRLPALISLANSPEVRRVRDYENTANQLDAADIETLYLDLVEIAPMRSTTGKQYFVGHTGMTENKGVSNRVEEHLAIALMRESPSLALPGIGVLDLLDYQVPLKARRSDVGVGKIDLLGVTGMGRLVIVELKTATVRSPGDNPLRALLESLAYAALLEADIDAISVEAAQQFSLEIARNRPTVVVAAPAPYWKFWSNRGITATIAAGARLAERLGTAIAFVNLGSASVTMGTAGLPPALNSKPNLTTIHATGAW